MTEIPAWIFISLWIVWVLFGFMFIVVVQNAVTQHKKNLANIRRATLLLGIEVPSPPLRLTPAGYTCFFGFPIVTVFWISWNIFG